MNNCTDALCLVAREMLNSSNATAACIIANTTADVVESAAAAAAGYNSHKLLGLLAAPVVALVLGLLISLLCTEGGEGDYFKFDANRFYNPLATELTALVNTCMLGPLFCHSDPYHPIDRKHPAVYWEIRRKHILLHCPLHRYCESRYRKLRLAITLVSQFANRLKVVHPHDFEEIEVELEAMYSAVWSNIHRAWYRESAHWEFFIQKVYGRFYLTSEFLVWRHELEKYVDSHTSPRHQLSLFADRIFLPVGLTAIAVIGVLSFRLESSGLAFGFYVGSLGAISVALLVQGCLAYHSFHRRSNRYRGVLFFWMRRLIRLAYAISVVLDDFYELNSLRNKDGFILRPWNRVQSEADRNAPPPYWLGTQAEQLMLKLRQVAYRCVGAIYRPPSVQRVEVMPYFVPKPEQLEESERLEANEFIRQGKDMTNYRDLWNLDDLPYCEEIADFIAQKDLENRAVRGGGPAPAPAPPAPPVDGAAAAAAAVDHNHDLQHEMTRLAKAVRDDRAALELHEKIRVATVQWDELDKQRRFKAVEDARRKQAQEMRKRDEEARRRAEWGDPNVNIQRALNEM